MTGGATGAQVAADQSDVAFAAVDFALVGDHAEFAVAGSGCGFRRRGRCSARGAGGSG